MSDEARASNADRIDDLPAADADVRGGADSLSELGEQDQLRMQLYMDRKAKAEQQASDLLKKASSTTSSIVGNMK